MLATQKPHRGIPFSGPMVLAMMEGRKTQTRRLIKPQPHRVEHHKEALCIDPRKRPKNRRYVDVTIPDGWGWKDIFYSSDRSNVPFIESLALHCPYGEAGARLYVREAIEESHLFVDEGLHGVKYCADGQTIPGANWAWQRGKLPSIFMPHGLHRIVIELTRVWVERLQDITKEGAIAEGVTHYDCGHPDCGGKHYGPRGAFMELWDKLNVRRAPWDSNPFVWCLEFRCLGSK